MKTEKLQTILDDRFGGVLSRGKHDENGEGCAMEVLSVALHKGWTDNPIILRTFDLRPINDIYVADEIRTKHLLPVIAAYAGSMDWPMKKQMNVISKIIILMVNRIISVLPDLSESIFSQCKNADTLELAVMAASAVKMTGWEIADVARAAIMKPSKAARAASAAVSEVVNVVVDEAAKEKIFVLACEIWMEALN